MADKDNQNPSLGEAAVQFLAKLSPKEREASQPEVYKFARWYGWERPFARLAAPEVASYAEQLSLSDTDYARKLELIRTFLEELPLPQALVANVALRGVEERDPAGAERVGVGVGEAVNHRSALAVADGDLEGAVGEVLQIELVPGVVPPALGPGIQRIQ